MTEQSEKGCIVVTVVAAALCCGIAVLLLGGAGVALASLSARSLALGAAGFVLIGIGVWQLLRQKR